MFLVLAISLCILQGYEGAQKKNVLFLVDDDLRPELSCYVKRGKTSPIYPNIITPNLDRLASQSLLFKRAYVQQAVCTPSRTSFLTGRRPDTTRVWDLHSYFRETGGNFSTIPQYFKNNGYRSIGMGKIFHPGRASGNNDPPSWSERYIRPSNAGFYNNHSHSWRTIPREQYQSRPLPDQQIAESAIQALRRVATAAKNGTQPFFVAVGFQKPHLPLVVPEEFLEMYPFPEVTLPANPFAPRYMPRIAWSTWGELRSFGDIASLSPTGEINTTLPDPVTIDLRRAYYSAVTYIDYLVGQVLTELENLGLKDETIVSFIGDHGWQLGDHGSWCKHTNFETSTHTPMMIRVPGLTDNGIISYEFVEFVDLFPTLSEAAGLGKLDLCPDSSSDVFVCTEGHSLMPLIRNPSMPTWKKTVFSQYPRWKTMGYSMRTVDHRYTEWVGFADGKPNWNEIKGAELYEMDKDPLENINKAGYQRMRELRARLSQQLRAGWRAAQPHIAETQELHP